jgi:hypothetical protein
VRVHIAANTDTLTLPSPRGRGWFLALLMAFSSFALAQNTPFEVGLDVTGTHLHKIDEAPVGPGVRFFVNFTNAIALDTEVARYPGKTSAVFGAKIGHRLNRFGVFGKTRFGLWHFTESYFAADLGGVVEYYPTRRTTVRIDAGDTVIYYGGVRLGTVHNFQPGIGFSYRF